MPDGQHDYELKVGYSEFLENDSDNSGETRR